MKEKKTEARFPGVLLRPLSRLGLLRQITFKPAQGTMLTHNSGGIPPHLAQRQMTSGPTAQPLLPASRPLAKATQTYLDRWSFIARRSAGASQVHRESWRICFVQPDNWARNQMWSLATGTSTPSLISC